MAVDISLGTLCAFRFRRVSKDTNFWGITKKIVALVLVGMSHVIDTLLIGEGAIFRTAVIFFFISSEGVSIMENAGHLGIPIPEKLHEYLSRIHGGKNK
jgi:toxin secretion/phage lysis holin